ncbi:hypothetical protein OE88DRAFT_1359480 [Heliocybe sulcata]|uniref:Uncharacterized protein n=1 Tax=Heliocybe sulcata TaxID=5364 RepID=A0A5C3MJ09_9AGAM|nr:hypothetical protein OE88DRAFT_1359480 [Heliocybe sulcata]
MPCAVLRSERERYKIPECARLASSTLYLSRFRPFFAFHPTLLPLSLLPLSLFLALRSALRSPALSSTRRSSTPTSLPRPLFNPSLVYLTPLSCPPFNPPLVYPYPSPPPSL